MTKTGWVREFWFRLIRNWNEFSKFRFQSIRNQIENIKFQFQLIRTGIKPTEGSLIRCNNYFEGGRGGRNCYLGKTVLQSYLYFRFILFQIYIACILIIFGPFIASMSGCMIYLLYYLCCSVDKQMAENLAQDMGDLMHDFDVVSRYLKICRVAVILAPCLESTLW